MSAHISENKQYYDQRFGSLSQTLNEEEQRRWQFLQKALSSLQLPSSARIADFGCGRGWLSNKLSAFGKVTGFDLSEKAVENAKQNFKNCDFFCLNAEAPLPSQFVGAFDVLVSSEVIEHTTAQKDYLKNCYALLKPGAYLLLSTPNGNWKNEFYKNGREAWKQPVENWLSMEELTGMSEALGFTTLSKTSFNAEWIFDFRPAPFTLLSQPLVRTLLKFFGLYPQRIAALNSRNCGLNLLLLAKKE